MSELPTTTRWEQCNEAGRVFFLQGELARAEESFLAAIVEAEGLGADNVRLASSLSNLGQLKYQQRDLAHAERLFRRSLEIRERSLGADHVSVAQNLNNLAALHVARNEHAEAEALLVRALRINEQERGPSHPDVAVTINNLAKLHFKRGAYADAEPLLLRLLALKQTPDKNNPEAAAVLASLATLRQATGHPAAAESLWRETLAIRERTLSPTDAALSPTLEGLADSCEAQRRWSDAISYRERALESRMKLLGPDHPVVTAAHARLVELRLRLAENPAAVPAPAHEPRLSALQMSSLDVDKAIQDASRADAKRPVPARSEPPNSWLETEPPEHIITGEFRPGGGGAAVASPPRRGPTPGSSATISPVRAPSPRSSTALPPTPGLGMFEVSAAAPASIGAEPGIWWDPSSDQKHATPQAAAHAMHAPERRSDPSRHVANHTSEDGSRRTHRSEGAPTSRHFGMVGAIAAGLVLVFGTAAWTLLGREDAAPSSPAVERVAASVDAEPTPAPEEPTASQPEPDRMPGLVAALPAAAEPAAAEPATAARPAMPAPAKVESHGVTAGSTSKGEGRSVASVVLAPARAMLPPPTVLPSTAAPVSQTTIDATMLPRMVDLDRITRAIDDSTRKKVEASAKKLEMKPPTFKEP